MSGLTRSTKYFTAALFLLASISVCGQSLPGSQQKHIVNLIIGMNSENEGLKRSCIYFAGMYSLNQTLDCILEVLETEPDPATRTLIAQALYKIGNERGMNEVLELSQKDPDENVRKIAASLYDTYFLEKLTKDEFIASSDQLSGDN
ncbi:MAG: HEAT repeat domain-containing protein [Melioribacteraceae bacterium]|nr:HEAT repeat domain-containing protein [Melioribacteraceae bacterium]